MISNKVCGEPFAHRLEASYFIPLACFALCRKRRLASSEKRSSRPPGTGGFISALAWLRVCDFLGSRLNYLPYQLCSISASSLGVSLLSALGIMTDEVQSAIAVVNHKSRRGLTGACAPDTGLHFEPLPLRSHGAQL